MASPNQRTGKAYVKVNGQIYETMAGAKLSNIPGNEREAVVGTDVFGYAEKAVVPTVECEFAHSSSLSVQTLWNFTDATVTFECDSGPVFILRNGWTAKVTDLTGGKGTLAVTFNAKKCEEQLS